MKITLAIAALCGAAQADFFDWTEPISEEKMAFEKEEFVWKHVERTKGKTSDFEFYKTGFVMFESMWDSFEQTDFVQKVFGLFNRPKAIHSRGAVQKVEYVNLAGQKYTGVFESGGKHGFLRYSVARDYSRYKWGS